MFLMINNSVYDPEKYGDEEVIEKKVDLYYLDFDR